MGMALDTFMENGGALTQMVTPPAASDVRRKNVLSLFDLPDLLGGEEIPEAKERRDC